MHSWLDVIPLVAGYSSPERQRGGAFEMLTHSR
jgi:hypothetical protein